MSAPRYTTPMGARVRTAPKAPCAPRPIGSRPTSGKPS